VRHRLMSNFADLQALIREAASETFSAAVSLQIY
jgi:hypothetical protein